MRVVIQVRPVTQKRLASLLQTQTLVGALGQAEPPKQTTPEVMKLKTVFQYLSRLLALKPVEQQEQTTPEAMNTVVQSLTRAQGVQVLEGF